MRNSRTNRLKNWLAVIALIPLALLGLMFWMVIGALFKNSIWPGLDFGSLTDWMSALSSIFTACIAWKAFKAAPNWFKQKLDESAINLFIDLVENKASALDKRINQVIEFNHDAYSHLKDYAKNGKPAKDFNIHQGYQESVASIKKIAGILNEMNLIEESIKKRGWLVKPRYSVTRSGVQTTYRALNTVLIMHLKNYSDLNSELNSINNNGSRRVPRNFELSLNKTRNDIEEITTEISTFSMLLAGIDNFQKLFK